LQQLSGGVASSVAGMIVVQLPDGRLAHYDTLGFVVMAAMLLTIGMMYPIYRAVKEKMASANQAGGPSGTRPGPAAESPAVSSP
jgi:hypothetical protein